MEDVAEDDNQIQGPHAFRWRLEGTAPLRITAALRAGEAARAAVQRAAETRGLTTLPDAFHHGSGSRHDHAFYLPEDADEDGLITSSSSPPAACPIR